MAKGIPKAGKRKTLSTVDRLPEVTRKKVIDGLLTGKRLSKLAEIADCSVGALRNYRTRILVPALRRAEELQAVQSLSKKVSGETGLSSTTQTTREQLVETAKLTQELVEVSPFKLRLEKLYQRTDKALDRAEEAVRVVVHPKTGVLTPIGTDLSILAPLLGQAHKNVEMLGRATGELTAADKSTVVMIVAPGLVGQSTNSEVSNNARGQQTQGAQQPQQTRASDLIIDL